MTSIRRTLLIALLWTYASVIAVAAAATFFQARREANEMFDYHLRQLALSLRDQTFRNALGTDLQPGEEDFDFVIQVWDPGGVRLYLSHPHSTLPGQVRLGYAMVDSAEGQWRVFGLQLRGQTIQVSQPMRVRNRLAAGVALRTIVPLLALLPAFVALIWLLVGRTLKPLNRLAHAVSGRSASVLEPITEAQVPDEVKPLVDALNDLLVRLERAFLSQRTFITDAAHELRTPLTALQLQLQLAERARDEETRKAAIGDLRAGLQRAVHVVQQLLILARQEPGAGADQLAALDLGELASLVVTELTPLAESRSIDLGIARADAHASVNGDADALRSLVRNLVDNAVRYTPPGGKVDVAVTRDAASVALEVTDSGPGIPAAERERVFDRFYRSKETGESGSGLGLAIVRTIAMRHGTRVVLDDSPSGGLRARVVFSALETPGDR